LVTLLLLVVNLVDSGGFEGSLAERDAVLEVAKFMLVSARTAPKSGGIDDVVTLIVSGEKKDAIAQEMERIAERRGLEGFTRDAKNVRSSEAVVLIGVKGGRSFGLDCGACGFGTCKGFEAQKRKAGKDFEGPTCLFKALDLGIALGSAAKTASMLNVDNRIMYRVGAVALKLKLFPKVTVVMGIPVSAKGKSIFFDRNG
jgi:uncharacterized ferredoxin-like protein